jgi:hypothetical protein
MFYICFFIDIIKKMDAKQIMEAVIMLAAVSIVLGYLPGLVFQATATAPTVPATSVALYGAYGNTTANIGSGLTTVSVTPQLLAIVILLSVIMMLVHRGRSGE